MSGSETTVARVKLARENEERVIAEASLEGERMVAWARLLMCVLLSLSQMLRRLDGAEDRDLPRMLGVGAYVLFSVATVIVTHRVKGNPTGARRAFRLTLVDVGFFAFMGYRSWALTRHALASHLPPPVLDPELFVAAFLLPILFTISRFSSWQVVAATALCSVMYVLEAVPMKLASVHGAAFVVAAYAVTGVVVASAGWRVRRLFSTLRRRENLTRFLAPQVVEQLMTYGDAALAPTQREVTLLFSDLRDFTSLSERMEPRELLELLDSYFADMTQIVKGYDGIVNKFIGDGMLAVWGVPERSADHAALAMKAALAMRTRVDEINAARARQSLAPLRIGIGIHTGKVAAGMLGGADQHEYTVIGDAVNVASRIEGLNKEHRTDILVSDAAWGLTGSRFDGELVGESHVKGRSEPVRVFALRGMAISAPARKAG